MTKPLIAITGASSGIGAGIARLFSEAGYGVAMLSRNKSDMESLQLPNSICLSTDVTDVKSVIEAIQQAEKIFGPVDCLINNAGLGVGGEFTEVSHEDNEQMVKVNLLGILNCIETVLPSMRARQSGTIINISSVADRNARPLLSTYAATKAAVKSLSESLRMANARYGIRICNVAPAKVKTPMLKLAVLNEDNQIIEVDDIAKAVLWIYQQPQNICIRDIVVAPTYYES